MEKTLGFEVIVSIMTPYVDNVATVSAIVSPSNLPSNVRVSVLPLLKTQYEIVLL